MVIDSQDLTEVHGEAPPSSERKLSSLLDLTSTLLSKKGKSYYLVKVLMGDLLNKRTHR